MSRDPSRRRYLHHLSPFGLAALALVMAAPAEAAPPDEDWTLETRKDDELLIKQRFDKLKKDPFNRKQWNALEKALGRKGLIRKIEAASKRAPTNIALQILRAHSEELQGNPRLAAERLAKLDGKAGRWQSRVFDHQIEALAEAKAYSEAIAALVAESQNRKKGGDELIERAFEFADRAGMHERALELAEELATRHSKDVGSLVRVARAARSAGEHVRADEAFASAITKTKKGDYRNSLVAERARGRLDAGEPMKAAEILWGLLDDASSGRAEQREGWWEDLEVCYRKNASSEVLVEELEKWLKNAKHSKEVAAWQALARAQKAAGQDPIPALRKAIELAPRAPIARAALIEALEESGESEAALEEYRLLRGNSNEEIRLGLEMAERLITNGERETGLEIASEIRSSGGRNADTLLLLIDFYNTVDELDLALQTARDLVKTKSRSPDARLAFGEQLWEMGQRKEALEQWEQLPKLVKPAHKGWFRHAEILADHAAMDRGLRDTALTSLEKALRIKPDEPNYLRLQAVLEEERNRPDRALDIWEQVRDLSGSDGQELLRAEARTRIVELLAGPGLPNRGMRRDTAVKAAEAALRGGPSPEALEAGLFLAELYGREENYKAAVDMYTKLRDIFPDDPDRLMELAMAQRRAGQPEEAVRTLEKLLPLDPSREVDVLVALTELSHELGKAEYAREAAVRALKQGSAGIRALLRLGELNERRGNIEMALECYETVLEAHPDHARTRMRLAELQLTTNDIEGAANSFRDLLEAGGPSDLMRQAGARALDLAEVTNSTAEVLELAIKRTKREPNSAEPRDFLLATIDRVEIPVVEAWLRGGADKLDGPRDDVRVAALRRPLVNALSRASVSVRRRAAEHLGALALPDTAVHLARLGANLQPPNDSVRAVKNSFIATRVAALEAAGHLDDPAAIPVLSEIVDNRHANDARIRHAAVWALARSSHTDAAEPLRNRIRSRDDELTIAMSCLGLARLSRDDKRVDDLVTTARLARESSNEAVRRSCAFASASLTPDFRAVRLHPQLRDPDPMIAAIAAWRIGQVAPDKVDDASVEALFELYFGPAGLPRDAAIASLVRLLGESPGPGGIAPPPVPPSRRWTTIVDRWISDHLSPDYTPLTPAQVSKKMPQALAAWRRSNEGTRAEIAAATRAARGCDEAEPSEALKGDPQRLCLAPLVDGDVGVPGQPQ